MVRRVGVRGYYCDVVFSDRGFRGNLAFWGCVIGEVFICDFFMGVVDICGKRNREG